MSCQPERGAATGCGMAGSALDEILDDPETDDGDLTTGEFILDESQELGLARRFVSATWGVLMA